MSIEEFEERVKEIYFGKGASVDKIVAEGEVTEEFLNYFD